MRSIELLIVWIVISSSSVLAETETSSLPMEAQKIIANSRYQHAHWSVFAKDLKTGKVLYQINENRFVIPASTSKLVSVAALLNQYGEDYTFKTPVYAMGKIDAHGVLDGNLVLVGKGDLVFGGRALPDNKVAFTNFDHVDANHLPGATLTPQDPLAGIYALAKQIKQHGIRSIQGEVLIDDRLFETIVQRENVISPVMINENLFDIEAIPASTANQPATIHFRPQLSTMKIINKVITVEKGKESHLQITSNKAGNEFEITGTIALDNPHMLNTYPIENPKSFARLAFLQALQQEGITIQTKSHPDFRVGSMNQYANYKPVAEFVSPPLIEYVKLILKVSHNMGANLIPMLLASSHNQQSYAEGMHFIGDFLENNLHVDRSTISFADAAGGNSNLITPSTMMKVLEYFYQKSSSTFQQMLRTLPIMGVDGSLSSVANNTPAEGHVFAKTGTGIIQNMLKPGYFLLTAKALAGYYQKNNHWIAFYVVVNNGNLSQLMEVLTVNNDLGLITNALYTAK